MKIGTRTLNPHPTRFSSLTTKSAGHSITGVIAARNFIRGTAYPAFCERLAVVARPPLLSRAEDMTAQTATRSCVVLAPHPDDETLGCGATIMRKLAAGTAVTVVIATDGRHSHYSSKISAEALIEIREEEARVAASILGLQRERVVFLRFEDGHLTDNRRLLRDRLVEIIDTANPKEIFVSSIVDAHPDHRVLAELARDLAWARRDRSPEVYEYPIWFWDPRIWRVKHLLGLRPRKVRTENFLPRKREAIAAYRSQVTNLTGETSGAPLRPNFLRQFLQPEEIFFEKIGSRSAP
jgi:LmbE family N-acetylglucosaminyl deacetylase